MAAEASKYFHESFPGSDHHRQEWRRVCGLALLVSLGVLAVPGLGVTFLYPAALIALVPTLRLLNGRRSELQIPTLVLFVAILWGAAAVILASAPLAAFLSQPAIRILACLVVIVAVSEHFGLAPVDVTVASAMCAGANWIPQYWNQSFDSLWKYALGTPVALIALAILQRFPPRQFVTVAVMLATIIVSLMTAFRSEALQLALVLGFTLAARPNSTARDNAVRVVSAGALIVVSMAVIVPRVATSGVLGDQVRASFSADEAISSNPLLGGRVELPVSIAAFEQEPLLGQGRMPDLTTDILFRASEIADDLGIETSPTTIRSWSIPQTGQVSAHSVVMQMAIVSGIAGLMVGLYLLALVVVGLWDLAIRRPRHLAEMFLLTVACWDLMFSPMLTGRDLLIAAALYVAVTQRASRSRSAELSLDQKRQLPLPLMRSEG